LDLRHGGGGQTVAGWSGLRVCLSGHGRRSQCRTRLSSSWKASM
jgi:hypothetical protein